MKVTAADKLNLENNQTVISNIISFTFYGAHSTQKFSNAIHLDEEFSLKFHSCAQGFASFCTLLTCKSCEQAALCDEPTT